MDDTKPPPFGRADGEKIGLYPGSLPRVEAEKKGVDRIPESQDLFQPVSSQSIWEMKFNTSIRCDFVKIKMSYTFSRIRVIRLHALVTLHNNVAHIVFVFLHNCFYHLLGLLNELSHRHHHQCILPQKYSFCLWFV